MRTPLPASLPPATTTGPGATAWLTGLPSAGKSTLANAVAARLRASGRKVEVLDGDELRAHLSPDLGFSRPDREMNIRRIAYIARLLARNGVLALVPVIAPYEQARAQVRHQHESAGIPYLEIYVATALEVCKSRDVKGFYARQRAGEISGLTGVDDVYEAPINPDLRIDTAGKDVEACVDVICSALYAHGAIPELGFG